MVRCRCDTCGKKFSYDSRLVGSAFALKEHRFISVGDREYCEKCYESVYIKKIGDLNVPDEYYWADSYMSPRVSLYITKPLPEPSDIESIYDDVLSM